MQLPFRRIGVEAQPFELHQDGVEFVGTLHKFRQYVKLEAKLQGSLLRDCDICAQESEQVLCESIELLISDGMVSQPNESLDVVECERGVIEMDAILASELELIKSDYYRCESCEAN